MADGKIRRLDADTVVSIVIPCCDEELVLPLMFERLQRAIDSWGTGFEVILVDDGSRDGTWELMRERHRADPRWKMIRFARNFGHQTALRAGLHVATGDIVVVLDADLQDPPEVLPAFFAKWLEGYDVIYGVRTQRPESLFKRAGYYLFYRLLSKLAHHDIPLDAGDFCVMDQRITALIRRMPERHPFIRGLRSWVGFRQLALPYPRQRRAAGEPKYNLRRLLGLALDGVLSSSVVPLRLATGFGALVSVVAFIASLFILVLKLFPEPFRVLGMEAIPGTVSILISVLFLGGVQLVCLGICGEYLGRIYDNVKARPFWTIRETLGVEEPSSDFSGRHS